MMTSVFSDLSIGTEVAAIAAAAPADAAVTANRAVYVPFVVNETVTVLKLWYYSGTGTGNSDIGIYNAAGTLLISSGPVAQTASILVERDIADTELTPGRYYLAWTADNANTHLTSTAVTQAVGKALGLLQSTTASATLVTTPSWAVFGINTGIPWMGIAMRTLVGAA